MWCDISRQNFPQKHQIISHHMTSLSLSKSTFGITWCDNLWPNLRLEVAEGFHIRWRMSAAHDIDPFLQSGGQSPSFREATFGASPPPSFRRMLTPTPSLSLRSWLWQGSEDKLQKDALWAERVAVSRQNRRLWWPGLPLRSNIVGLQQGREASSLLRQFRKKPRKRFPKPLGPKVTKTRTRAKNEPKTRKIRCPTMEPFFVKKLPRFRGFFSSNLVCRGTSLAQSGLILTSFWSTAFRPISLGGPDLNSPISPGGPDLFSPISTYCVSQEGSMDGTPKKKMKEQHFRLFLRAFFWPWGREALGSGVFLHRGALLEGQRCQNLSVGWRKISKTASKVAETQKVSVRRRALLNELQGWDPTGLRHRIGFGPLTRNRKKKTGKS